MREYCDSTIISIANYILENKCTVRQCAQAFGISKSAVHSYLNTKLKYIDIDLYEDVRGVLEYNLSVRHLRGGESTRQLYRQKSKDARLGVN
ncbi:MAG: sporulation transcriptional regulator SpoIIID [Clostridia bacterium]|nr:sporulation transcriptional regulator SpoIIID [Clostridia bacterium]